MLRISYMNVIYTLTSFKGIDKKEIHYNKFRIPMDQKGIQRIEEPQFNILRL